MIKGRKTIKMIKPKPPCYRCEDRAQGCHSTCIRYKDYTKANDAYREYVRLEKMGHLIRGKHD